jgi:hypothetical protein
LSIFPDHPSQSVEPLSSRLHIPPLSPSLSQQPRLGERKANLFSASCNIHSSSLIQSSLIRILPLAFKLYLAPFARSLARRNDVFLRQPYGSFWSTSDKDGKYDTPNGPDGSREAEDAAGGEYGGVFGLLEQVSRSLGPVLQFEIV